MQLHVVSGAAPMLPSGPANPADASAAAVQRPLPGETVVWMLPLDQSEAEIAAGFALLNETERGKAGRYRFLADRRQFVMTRATLRRLLGAMLGQPPEAVRFGYGPFGKPEVAGEPTLKISVSHSAGLALIAVSEALSESCEMGIDLEEVREIPELEALAARCFSPAEQRALAALPESARTNEFFRLWVQTEAQLKASGMGLAALDEHRDVNNGCDQSWSVTLLDVGSRYKAAVAHSTPPVAIEIRQFSEHVVNRS